MLNALDKHSALRKLDKVLFGDGDGGDDGKVSKLDAKADKWRELDQRAVNLKAYQKPPSITKVAEKSVVLPGQLDDAHLEGMSPDAARLRARQAARARMHGAATRAF